VRADGIPVAEPLARDEVEELTRAAGWAPSGDNTQPWRFDTVAGRRTIEVVLDPARDASPMNAGQQMALIACGAAVENVCWLARARGLQADVETLPPGRPAAPTCVARVVLGERRQPDCAAPSALAITERVTNRRRYDGRPLDPGVRSRLERATVDVPGMAVHWVTDRALIGKLADRIALGDAVMFGEPGMRHAFLGNVRFDLPVNAEADEGLPIGSLEVSAADRLSLRAMRFLPDWLFALSGGARILGARTRKLVESSSGICLVAPASESDEAPLHLGRAAQHVWLTLTELGLAVQPMMSLPGLRFARTHGTPEQVRSLERLGVAAALRDFEQLLESAGLSRAPGFVLRFGYAPPPTCRAVRLT
jgi:nitroreductase